MDKLAFINSVKTGAILTYSKYGVLPSLTIAQAILESGWGESQLTKRANNLFGIKKGYWKGNTVTMQTTEYDTNGKSYQIDAEFRAYESWQDSILDHAILLNGDRYQRVIRAKNYNIACDEIYKAGYATDPLYPDLLKHIIENNKLNDIDEYVLNDKIFKRISEVFRNMDIAEVQKFLNNLGITDKNGNKLVVDGLKGELTDSAIEKAKKILGFILQ